MSTRKLSTHILDTSRGKAAGHVKVTVYRLDEAQQWQAIRPAETDDDGRCQLLSHNEFPTGIYKLTFHVGAYFAKQNVKTIYPAIDILVDCSDPDQHYHIPLLLNPYGYSTYRGT